MRMILMLVGTAALSFAQSPIAAKATLNEMASTRWFLDATIVEADSDEVLDDESELKFTVNFDAKGNVQIECGASKFAATNPKQQANKGQTLVSAEFKDAKLGKLQWHATVKKTGMTGKIVWLQVNGNKYTYECSGRKATELEGVQWKLIVRPEKVEEDDEVDPPFTETLEVRRGLLQVVETDDSELFVEPAAVELTKKGKSLTMVTGATPHRDGDRWQLDIDGKSLTGSLVSRSDQEIVARYSVKGSRIETSAASRR
jgi:hypothetical protein